MTERREPSIAETAAVLAGVLVLSSTLAVLALLTASGVTRTGPDSYKAEFTRPEWVWAGLLLVVPLFFAARRHPDFKGFFALAALLPQYLQTVAEQDEYAAAGIGHGTSGIGLIWPLMLTPLFIWVVCHGGDQAAKRSVSAT
ncbi:hypothetical protein [Actinoplanes xinjiangensis]|uniref:hypothetical protein n=1 Tax=Actinoplanes xinjiangensis TaxID=512350 RepID=UPI003445B4F4